MIWTSEIGLSAAIGVKDSRFCAITNQLDEETLFCRNDDRFVLTFGFAWFFDKSDKRGIVDSRLRPPTILAQY